MESFSLPMKGQASRTARGCLGVWSPAPSLFVLVIRGHGEADFAEPIIRVYDRLSAVSPLHLFADVGDMLKYDSRLRTALTARFVADRLRIANFPILVRSKLVAMGVSVANLALGGQITSHTSDRTFRAALDKSLFDLRIVGFSSQALASVTLSPPAAFGSR